MSGKRYTEEFKIEAVKQVTDQGYYVLDVAEPGSGHKEPIRLDQAIR